jgi:hypothetical protein
VTSMQPVQPRRVARLVVAQDVLAGVGLVAGVALSIASLYVIIRKYFPPKPPPAGGTG